jgi:hypothetical protein
VFNNTDFNVLGVTAGFTAACPKAKKGINKIMKSAPVRLIFFNKISLIKNIPLSKNNQTHSKFLSH